MAGPDEGPAWSMSAPRLRGAACPGTALIFKRLPSALYIDHHGRGLVNHPAGSQFERIVPHPRLKCPRAFGSNLQQAGGMGLGLKAGRP